jgi:hypothetical protein
VKVLQSEARTIFTEVSADGCVDWTRASQWHRRQKAIVYAASLNQPGAQAHRPPYQLFVDQFQDARPAYLRCCL